MRNLSPDTTSVHVSPARLTVKRRLGALCAVASVAAILQLGVSSADAFTFSKVTDASNPIVTDGGHGGGRYFGASWIDYDGDGDIDLFADLDALYRNDGDGNFTRILGSGLGDGQVASASFSMSGNSWGDYDNDGDLDAFIAGEASYLYRNDGSDTFTRITTGDIGGGTTNRGWTCAWADYDDDGNLDLVIIHPAGFIPGGPAIPNRLFRNDGPPNYTFTQILDGPIVTGLDSYTVGSWSDYDGDGDIDLFIGSGPANGTQQPDNLYRNLLTETGVAEFERILESPIGTENQDGQVWNWIDYDNDRDLDAFVTNYAGGVGGLQNRLYRRETDGTFTSITDQPLTIATDRSLGSLWGDFDNDGDLDCWVGNDGARPARMYENNGDGTFTDRVDTPVTTQIGARRGASLGDYDDDGDLDLFANGPLGLRSLFRNEATTGNFLVLTLMGAPSNRSAIGAKVYARAVIAGDVVWQMREVSAQNSFNGHNSLRVHFGLGDAATVDSLLIEWPGGGMSEMTGVFANQFIDVVEGETTDTPAPETTIDTGLYVHPNPFFNETTIGYASESSQPVRITVHDVRGRRVRTLLADRALPIGRQQAAWDGTDDSGTALPGGVYLYRVEHGDHTQSGSVTLMR